jgi:AraC-like DNA-binding protein/quercetin dioxygenase-like cupin family protein
MIDDSILEKLMPISDEEQAFLDGATTIDRDRYMPKHKSMVTAGKVLPLGKLITIRPHPRFIPFPEHTHDYVEIVYMCSGSTTHIINGCTITLKEGELLFLGQNARQEIKAAKSNDIAVNFIILPQFFDRSLTMMGETEAPLRRFIIDCLNGNTDGPAYLHFKVTGVLPIKNLIENLLWTLLNNTPNKRMLNQTTMGLLFLQLLDHTDKLSYDSNEKATVLNILRYIDENYRKGSLTEAAEILHCDLYWLSREIKRKTGKTFTELLQEKRLTVAAALLTSTDMNIANIANTVGYDNVSYFHKIFKIQFKTSPKQYRNCK